MASPAERHAKLVKEIEAHNYRYYVLDDPVVTDAAFDALLSELRALETRHPELATRSSPTQRVGGAARSEVVKVKHPERMFSLDNAYGPDDLAAFHERVVEGLPAGDEVAYVVEPKLDGASVEVVYEGGALAQASTRGDGETGEDITVNVRTIKSVPLHVRHAGRLVLRGEIVIYRKDLEAMNEERAAQGLEPFANPRNAAAGSIRMMDPREVAARPLRAIFYQCVEGAELHRRHSETLDWMAELALPTHRLHRVCAWDAVAAAIRAIGEARAAYPYETDGAVVKVDLYRQHDQLGFTAKFPKWAIAYKFAPERARTRVRAVEFNVGRTGALTPVAVLDPVELGGTTVSRASLHNPDQIAELDVRLGDHVFVEKAGEIIPQVVLVDEEARTGAERPVVLPSACPDCGAAAEMRQRALVCPNRACPAKVKALIHYFARRFAMDIPSLGPALVEQLVGGGLVRSVADLYTLDAGSVASLERMGKKSADNVIKAVAASKERTLDRLLCGLGIPQVGQVAAKQLAEAAGTLEELLAWDEPRLREQVDAIPGFGEKMVDSVVEFMFDPDQRALMEKLVRLGVGRPQPKESRAKEGPLAGMTFCVTGVLSKKREDVHADIRAAGGEVHDSVKKGTTHLVRGEKTGKAKLDAAKKHGTRVLGEEELYALIAGAGATG